MKGTRETLGSYFSLRIIEIQNIVEELQSHLTVKNLGVLKGLLLLYKTTPYELKDLIQGFSLE